jgi:hypothetical protein
VDNIVFIVSRIPGGQVNELFLPPKHPNTKIIKILVGFCVLVAMFMIMEIAQLMELPTNNALPAL